MDEKGSHNQNGSSLNLDENVSGLLCYLGTFITGIIFVILEKKSQFVRFHALQSIVLFGGLYILYLIVGIFPVLVGGLLRMFISVAVLVLWIVLMVKTYQKDTIKLPVVGDIAESFMKK